MESPPAEAPVKVAALRFGDGEFPLCASMVSLGPGDLAAGIPFMIGGLATDQGAYDVEAWIDWNANDMPDDGEPEGGTFEPVAAPATGILIELFEGFEEGPTGCGGDLSASGTATYAGTAVGAPMIGLGGPDCGSLVTLEAPGAFSVDGLVPGDYMLFAWIDTDGIDGPGAFEPMGFFDPATKSRQLNVSDNVTDLSVTFLDPPEEGWPPEMFEGPEGGHGGEGCEPADATGMLTISGTVRNKQGDVLTSNVYIDIENTTARRMHFTDVAPDGTYSCTLPPGAYRVQGHSPDHGFYAEEVTLSSADVVVDLDLSFDFRPPYSRPTVFYGGTVWGNVTVGGVGVEGVRVSLFRSYDPSSGGPYDCQPSNVDLGTFNTCGAEAETNGTGGFVITHLADGTYDLFVDGQTAEPPLPNHWDDRAVTISGATNQSQDLHALDALDFDPPATIRGTITYDDGGTPAPVANAQVNAWPQCMPSQPCNGGWAQTDENGAYEMAVSPGSYGMFVSPPSGSSLQSARVDCGDFPEADCIEVAAGQSVTRDFTLEAGSTFRGRLVDAEGNGVRGWIQAQKCPVQDPNGPHMPCDFAWGQTDFTNGPPGSGDGGFFNLTVSPGTWQLQIQPDPYERPDLASLTLERAIGQGETLLLGAEPDGNLVLGAGLRLRGNITAGGEPLPWTNLWAKLHTDGPEQGPHGPPLAWAFTNEDGEYDMRGLPPLGEGESYDIVVEPGWGSDFMRHVEEGVTFGDAMTRWLDLTLSGGGTIAGYVRDADGLPVEGAFVDAFWTPDFEPGQPGGGGDVAWPTSGNFGHDVTDANGHYSIGGLTDGTFGMWVNPPSDLSLTTARLDPFQHDLPLVAIDETTYQNFTLGTAGSILGCLKTADASPVASAWVSAFSPTNGWGGGEVSGDDGCFELGGLAEGTYDLEINPPYNSDLGRTFVRGIVVESSGEVDVGDVTMSEGVRLEGTVVDADGNPVAHAFVNVFQIQESPGAGPGVFGWTQSAADGTFRVSGLQAGRYGAHVQPPWDSDLSAKFIPQIEIPSTGLSGYEIELGGGGYIVGTVTANGVPVQNAWIGAWSQSGGGSGTLSAADGTFNLSGLAAADDYNFGVSPPWGRQDLAGHHEWPVTVVEGQETLIDVALEAGGTLVGHVEDADGESVAYAFVNVNGNDTFGWGQTDSNGNFTVNGLRADDGDELTIFVQPNFGASFVPTRVTHTWAPNEDAISDAGDIVVGAGVNLTGMITRDGVGLADVEVFVWPAQPYHGPPIGGSATTNADGWYNVTGLPEGQLWDVRVEPNDGGAGDFTPGAVTTDGESTRYDVALGAGAGLDVRVLSAPDTGIEGARVDCFSEALHAGRGGSTDATGSVSFTGLPAGSYACRVFAPGHVPSGGAVELTAGETASVEYTLAAATVVDVFGNFTNASGAVSGFFVLLVPSGEVDDDETTGFDSTSDLGAFELLELPTANEGGAILYDLKIINPDGALVASRLSLDLAALDAADGDADDRVDLGTIASGSHE